MSEPIQAGKFSPNEKAYVPHTDNVYYEAKILKAEYRGQTGWFYFLHYNGWNKKYDEWVEEAGLVKAEVAEAAGAGAPAPVGKGRRGGGGGGPKGRGGGSRTPKAVIEAPPILPGARYQLDLDVPPIIIKHLLDDYDNVYVEKRLVPLPRHPSVVELLEQYVQAAKEQRTGTVDAEEEVQYGLVSYFDKCLPVNLLYNNERDQAAEVLASGRTPSSVYGAEHLIRLIHKLSDIMPLHLVSEDVQGSISTMVQDVLVWMSEHHATLFLPRDSYLPSSDPALVKRRQELLAAQARQQADTGTDGDDDEQQDESDGEAAGVKHEAMEVEQQPEAV